MATVWCVPGAPLTDGTGWRIWYAHPDLNGFEPQPVRVRTDPGGEVVRTRQDHVLLQPLPDFDRRIAIATVRLPEAALSHTFRVYIPEIDQEFQWPTLPDRVPSVGLSFVMASCFWRNDDKDGHYLKAVETVMQEKPRPAFKLLMGDQVYLDWPPLGLRAGSVSRSLGERYSEYWGDEAYRRALLTAPNFFVCDDHEFWNDFPERQVHLPYTWTAGGRNQLAEEMTAYYRSFQSALNGTGQAPWVRLDIPPASFFIADTRSTRTEFGDGQDGHVMFGDQFEALQAWQRELTGPGILVLGQPLFEKDGDWKDHSLSNFRKDYARLLGLIERSLRGENNGARAHDILILSGDIHTARHATATLPNLPDLRVHELIASPISRVGPFISTPKPTLPPQRLAVAANGAGTPWTIGVVEQATPFPSVDNNLGVVHLAPSEKPQYSLRVSFRSYRVRPYRRPAWQFWAAEPAMRFGDIDTLRLYEIKDLYLR